MFLNTVAIDAVRTAPIQRWWYKAIAIIDPAHITSNPPHAYMSVVNESSRWLFSALLSTGGSCNDFLLLCSNFIPLASIHQLNILMSNKVTHRDLAMVTRLLGKDSFPCRTKVCKVSSKFHSCWIVDLTINLGVQVWIWSNWNCGCY
jgi:hypothetical protein